MKRKRGFKILKNCLELGKERPTARALVEGEEEFLTDSFSKLEPDSKLSLLFHYGNNS